MVTAEKGGGVCATESINPSSSGRISVREVSNLPSLKYYHIDVPSKTLHDNFTAVAVNS